MGVLRKVMFSSTCFCVFFSKPYSIHEIDPSHICPTYDCKFITYAIRGFVVIIAKLEDHMVAATIATAQQTLGITDSIK